MVSYQETTRDVQGFENLSKNLGLSHSLKVSARPSKELTKLTPKDVIFSRNLDITSVWFLACSNPSSIPNRFATLKPQKLMSELVISSWSKFIFIRTFCYLEQTTVGFRCSEQILPKYHCNFENVWICKSVQASK